MYDILIKIPIIRNFIKKHELLKVTNFATCGRNLTVGRGAQVLLLDGSTKADVILEDNVCMQGRIASQNHGKVHLGKFTRMGANSVIQCVDEVTIGDYTGIAVNTCITDNNNHPVHPEFHRYMHLMEGKDDSHLWRHSDHAKVIIGENCWIGQNVRIQKGVTIGNNSIIAANSVVTKDVPTNCIAAGNPARVVKTDIDKNPAPTSCKGFNAYLASKE